MVPARKRKEMKRKVDTKWFRLDMQANTERKWFRRIHAPCVAPIGYSLIISADVYCRIDIHHDYLTFAWYCLHFFPFHIIPYLKVDICTKSDVLNNLNLVYG